MPRTSQARGRSSLIFVRLVKLLAGTRELIACGEPVAVTAAAAEVGMSKATAYHYFSDARAMAAEAGIVVEFAHSGNRRNGERPA